MTKETQLLKKGGESAYKKEMRLIQVFWVFFLAGFNKSLVNCALYHCKVLSSTVRSEILFPVLKLSPLFLATANVPFAYSAH